MIGCPASQSAAAQPPSPHGQSGSRRRNAVAELAVAGMNHDHERRVQAAGAGRFPDSPAKLCAA